MRIGTKSKKQSLTRAQWAKYLISKESEIPYTYILKLRKHRHAIESWVEGATILGHSGVGEWYVVVLPHFHVGHYYRVAGVKDEKKITDSRNLRHISDWVRSRSLKSAEFRTEEA